jgi:hypothetical protein
MPMPRWRAYLALWAFALAFGYIEAMVVVYLHEIVNEQLIVQGLDTFRGLRVTEVVLPDRYVRLEIAREACTMVLLAAGGWLAGRRTRDRQGAFLLSFGVWDLMYYAILSIVEGWPRSLRDWDILFLIPVPWVAPVWTPVLIATLFIVFGSYMYWTPDRERRWGWRDGLMFTASALIIIASFVRESSAAADHRIPESFPVFLYVFGVALGTGWFVRLEAATRSG